ncbi:MAG: alcohol dehydrogenase catalytic domain-containing protein [Spirochaetia bacterium]|jgi:threonine dehydrogenase-like Zn-dependent dehydrogenase
MKQSVLVAPRQSRIEERPIPQVGEADVLVKVKACGICTSELLNWSGDNGSYPREIGHEVAGEVVAVGGRVSKFRPGMAVTGLFHSGFAEFVVARQELVTHVPKGMGLTDALGEPLACILSGARRTPVEMGDTVALVGLGFMGLLMLQAVRLKGPAKIIGVDTRTEARKKALLIGADEVLAPDQVTTQLKLTEWSQLGRGCGVDVAFETSGTQGGLTLAGQMPHEHGVLSIVGFHQGGPRQVDMELWNWKALQVINAHERRQDYLMDCMRRGLDLIAAGKLDMASLVTHRFGLDQVDDAFRALLAKPTGFIKATMVIDQ